MYLTDLMRQMTMEPRTIREHLNALPEVSTTEFLATLFEAATLKLVTINGVPSRNPLEAMVWLRVDSEDARSVAPTDAQAAHNAKEAEADIVERYEAAQEAFKDMRARAEALSDSLNTMRRQGTRAVSELTMLANAMKDERPSMAEAILSAARLIPHE